MYNNQKLNLMNNNLMKLQRIDFSKIQEINTREELIESIEKHEPHYLVPLIMLDGFELLENTKFHIYEIINEDEDEEYLVIFEDKESLIKTIKYNLETLDLKAGADDRYYDYNPNQVDGLSWAILRLDDEGDEGKLKSQFIEQLLKKLKDFQALPDEDMDYKFSITQLENYLKDTDTDKATQGLGGRDIIDMYTSL